MKKTPPKITLSPRTKKLIYQFLGGLAVLVIAVFFLAYYFQDSILHLSKYFVDSFGLYGIFFGLLITDGIPFGLTHEPLIFLGLKGGLGFWPVIFTASSASILAGCLGYLGGRFLGTTSLVKGYIEKMDKDVSDWVHHYGVWIVAIGALTPFPFAPTAWMAGTIRLPFFSCLLAFLLRIPKISFYLWIMVKGWSWGMAWGAV